MRSRPLLILAKIFADIAAVIVEVVIDAPGDAGALQPLRVSLPCANFSFIVIGRGATLLTVRIDRSCHQVIAIGICGTEHRTMIAVADREGVGQRIVIRDVGARVIAHGERTRRAVRLAMRADPIVHRAAIPGCVLRPPAMIQIV